jgi:sirohydrochlorin ferrochelatase
VPTIAAAVRGFFARDILVCPLFMSDGYFARVRLPKLIEEAQILFPSCSVSIQPVFGLNPGLPQVIAARVAATLRSCGREARETETTIVLLAHGSTKDNASRYATEQIALGVKALRRFAGVACAFLEEAPTLIECVSAIATPVVVIGLFIGDGLHGHEEVSELIGMLDSDIAFGGNVGEWPEVADLVAASICEPC